MKKNAAIAVGFLLEFDLQLKVLEVFVRYEIALLLVRTALAYELSFVNIPFFRSMDVPACKVFTVEKFDLGKRSIYD